MVTSCVSIQESSAGRLRPGCCGGSSGIAVSLSPHLDRSGWSGSEERKGRGGGRGRGDKEEEEGGETRRRREGRGEGGERRRRRREGRRKREGR